MALAAALCSACFSPSSPGSALRGVRSRLKSSPARVHKRGGSGAPGAELVTRFPPLSSYDLLLPPPSSSSHFSCPVLIASVSLQQPPSQPHLTPSHLSSPAATLTLLGRGAGERGRLRLDPVQQFQEIQRFNLKSWGGCNRSWELGSAFPSHKTRPPHLPPPLRRETLPRSQGSDPGRTRGREPGAFVVALRSSPEADSRRSCFKCINENIIPVKSLT